MNTEKKQAQVKSLQIEYLLLNIHSLILADDDADIKYE